jgi:hypothetical protein
MQDIPSGRLTPPLPPRRQLESGTPAFRILLIALAAALLLAACGRPEPAASTTPEAPAASGEQVTPQATTPAPSPVATLAGATPAASELAAATIEPQSSGDAELYHGIPQGYTDDGFPYLGSPDAPITLYDYSDFL